MSNILIIKHGSLGDIAQASGVIQDISENHKDEDVFILTTKPYLDLFRKNPFIKEPILDRRLSRFNLFYLYSLMRSLKKYNFLKIYDLQNSNRTSFYKNILFKNSNKDIWSSSLTTLPEGKTKKEFDIKNIIEQGKGFRILGEVKKFKLKIEIIINKSNLIEELRIKDKKKTEK